MKRAAVLGSPVKHSLSPALHRAGYKALGLDWEYEAVECVPEELPEIASRYDGLSVTMPNKFAAFEFADKRTERCERIGSANTLVRTEEGWLADNTDGLGALGAISRLCKPKSVCLIGAGGTARAIVWALGQLGVESISLVNRSDRLQELQEVADIEITWGAPKEADLVVSTVPSKAITGREEELAIAPVFDVIYDPSPTELQKAAERKGFRSVGGKVMLAHQAFAQFELFTGEKAPQEAMWAAL